MENNYVDDFVNSLLVQPVKSYENTFTVDIDKIVYHKHKIPMQYEDINIGGNSDDLHYLSKKLDRYLLHIVEEIAEFLEEVEKLNFKKNDKIVLNENEHNDCLMELIDIIAYISSIVSILYIDYYGLDAVSKNDYSKITNGYKCINSKPMIFNEDFLATYNSSSADLYSINDILMGIEKILMLNVRRKFPERKWHKDTNRILSVLELKSLYEECIIEIIDALTNAISLFLYLTNSNWVLFNKMFLEKNGIVYSLKK